MVEMFYMTTKVHIFFILVLTVIIIRNLVLLYSESNFITLAKKIRFPTAMFHTLVAVTLFTGTLLMLLPYTYDLGTDAKFNVLSIVMIAITIFIMVAEIKRYKKLRVIKSKEIEKQNEFKQFAKKIYIIDLILIFSIFFLYKFFI